MGRPEGVVDVDVGVAGERRRELRVVLLLLRVEAEVLEQQHLAGLHALDGILRAGAERVAGDRDVLPEQLGETLRDRPQAERVLDLAVGPPEVARQDHASALLEQAADRRDARRGCAGRP